MEDPPESLEQKVETSDWKQWLPIYGIYQVERDFTAGKPTIIDKGEGFVFNASAGYQAVSVAAAYLAGIVYGLYPLVEKLF